MMVLFHNGMQMAAERKEKREELLMMPAIRINQSDSDQLIGFDGSENL